MHNVRYDERVTIGLLVPFPGVAKFMGGIGSVQGMLTSAGLPAAWGYGVCFGEVVGPALLILGRYARIGAALIVINMLFVFGLARRASQGRAAELQVRLWSDASG